MAPLPRGSGRKVTFFNDELGVAFCAGCGEAVRRAQPTVPPRTRRLLRAKTGRDFNVLTILSVCSQQSKAAPRLTIVRSAGLPRKERKYREDFRRVQSLNFAEVGPLIKSLNYARQFFPNAVRHDKLRS